MIELDFGVLFVIAIFVEAVTETIKWIYSDKTLLRDRLVALGVGLLIAILTGFDLFKQIGLELTVPYVGSILTGILLARGANYIHDLAKLFSGLATRLSPKSE